MVVGTEECDDGALGPGVVDPACVNGDGCTTTSTIECGWKCSNGTLTTRSFCNEICGDGFNMGQYECDDGNDINFDGCNNKCEIEKGW